MQTTNLQESKSAPIVETNFDKMGKKKQQRHLYWPAAVCGHMHYPCLASDL